MSAKKPITAKLLYVTVNGFVPPVGHVEGAPLSGKVPVIEARTADGRPVYVTFEYGDLTTRENYTRRMRALGQAIVAAADRRDANPDW